MPGTAEILSRKSLVLVLAYAPTGLGHLRVTYALNNGLPEGVLPVLLGSQDDSLTYLHRLASSNTWGRKIQEIIQSPPVESIFIPLYRFFLKLHTEELYKKLLTILDQRITEPKSILVVSTHFGLGHQLVELKKRLAKERGVKMFVVVVVTDDTVQQIWYVNGADLTFVPSETTKKGMIEFAEKHHLAKIPIVVSPYPVSPKSTKPISSEEFATRKKQVTEAQQTKIHMAIPISGAAVWLDFYTRLILGLHVYSDRFLFHVVSKEAPYTYGFLKMILKYPFIRQYTSIHDREVINLYEDVYRTNIISLEVTKPSEQAFKALINPDQSGGSLLLLSSPVGRQEYDNLAFLRRHFLLPSKEEKQLLWRLSLRKARLKDESNGIQLIQSAKSWRSVELPQNPLEAAFFIWWMLKEGIFSSMMECRTEVDVTTRHGRELGFDGVQKIWNRVAQLIETSYNPSG
ncbi:hypothetical protein A3D03_00625 [Candidatus Gottesmanbacteria bacterium RIFCSPHIGHO2_02_FULL_40_13]|uniref:Uncharacterized protein n=1 Tax=Candidatus Gottesmanbacteria bacterium RIFCSPHIGHO2_02_FULL_40_13 TaxID=1798384 RepID=A0A1F6A702_9BACT|nr:MAG: hypothetical protein A3D03_00625 [Candidatus Gottesmanbacteria bacterium RIFCSPHIGHO2_02_FULL_40_13]